MKIFILPVLFLLLLNSCNNSNSRPVQSVKDTTITVANAVTDLFIDSLQLEQFITSAELDESKGATMRNFYISRNYQYAWFTSNGPADQTRAFWNLHNNYINLSKDNSHINKKLHQQMDLLVSEDSSALAGRNDFLQTEMQLTEHFFEYAQYAYAGKVDPEELQWHIPRKKIDVMVLLDSLVANKGKNIEDWEPVNTQYKLMNKELARYSAIEKAGGWDSIVIDKKSYKINDRATAIRQVKQRLFEVGDYSLQDTTNLFTPELESAVKQAQKRFGYNTDGKIDRALVNDLNVPVSQRIEQLLVNMERMRWMPKEAVGNRIIANIPEFKVHVYEGNKQVFDMNIVVGTSANRTVIFNDMLKYVVFSPYWNVPSSIVRNEILPAMRRNSNYLSRKNMEQTGTSNGLPVIRQLPGGSNALGRVKFIFPNNYNIYFHDTPAKSLFENEKRAFSHGCIRLSEPRKMAEYLLRDNSSWTTEEITTAMNASKEKWVPLKEAVPVLITYFTSWIDNEGLLNFRDDIYGHDKKMAQRLFEHTDLN